jgi:hypothetical protein
MAKTFIALSSSRLVELICTAQKRVAVVAPSIHNDVGAALFNAVSRLGTDNIDIVVDLDEKVFRLGYGSIDAIKLLKENDIKIRHHKGLRIGLVIIDEQAWAFSPVALYIETEPDFDDLPNAVALSSEEAARLLLRVSDSARSEVIRTATDPELIQEAKSAVVELSQFSDNSRKLDEVCKSLEDAPPVPFDVSRQVQVFEPYIQYVDLKLQGCSIQNHKMQLPPHILGLASTREFEDRLSTTFNLIEKSSSVSAKHLDDDVRKLRDMFTRSLGKLGRVLLKAQRKNFDNEVEKIREQIELHREKIKNELGGELDKTKAQLVDNFLSPVMSRPPKELLFQLSGSSLTEGNARKWLEWEIGRCIPQADKLITKMELECVFKDVTYETLKDVELMETLKKAFPLVDWDKPFREFTAAKEVETGANGV